MTFEVLCCPLSRSDMEELCRLAKYDAPEVADRLRSAFERISRLERAKYKAHEDRWRAAFAQTARHTTAPGSMSFTVLEKG